MILRAPIRRVLFGTGPVGLIGGRLLVKSRVIEIHVIRWIYYDGYRDCSINDVCYMSSVGGRLKDLVRRRRKMVWPKTFTTQQSEREVIVANHPFHTLGVPSGVSRVVGH